MTLLTAYSWLFTHYFSLQVYLPLDTREEWQCCGYLILIQNAGDVWNKIINKNWVNSQINSFLPIGRILKYNLRWKEQKKKSQTEAVTRKKEFITLWTTNNHTMVCY